VKLAMEKGKRRKRTENNTFVAFRSHYLFDSHFCTPRSGWEKGQVEHDQLCRHFCHALHFTLLLPAHQGARPSRLKAARSV
jgi:IS30 family transposase